MASDIGKYVVGGAGAILVWKSFSKETKDGIARGVVEVLNELARQSEQRKALEAQVKQAQLPATQEPALDPVVLHEPNPVRVTTNENAFQSPSVPEPADDHSWNDLISHPSILVILGKRGSGKSALGYRLLEQFRGSKEPYVVGLPQSALKHLPDWIGVADSLDDVPPGACALVDEAYMLYHARDSHSKASKEMSRQLNLSRQLDQTLIFITQESRQVDKNVISIANVIVFKEPAALQVQFERPEVRKIAEAAVEAFQGQTGDRRKWSYVFSPEADFVGVVENTTASFWSNALSTAFAGGNTLTPAKPRSGKKMSIPERRERVQYLRDLGWSLNKIAKDVGVSKATVINDLKEQR